MSWINANKLGTNQIAHDIAKYRLLSAQLYTTMS